MSILRALLAIVLFIPLSLLRIVGCFLAQRQETAEESFSKTWKALWGDSDEEAS